MNDDICSYLRPKEEEDKDDPIERKPQRPERPNPFRSGERYNITMDDINRAMRFVHDKGNI